MATFKNECKVKALWATVARAAAVSGGDARKSCHTWSVLYGRLGGHALLLATLLSLGQLAQAMNGAPNPSGDGSYTVSWSSPAGHFEEPYIDPWIPYSIYDVSLVEQINGGSATTVVTSQGNTSKAFSGKANGSYSYSIVATGVTYYLGQSYPFSDVLENIDTPVTVAIVPAPPGGLSHNGGNPNYTGSYTVSWGSVAGASFYHVSETYQGDLYTSSNSIPLSGRPLGTHYYWVRACNESWQCSAWNGHLEVTVAVPGVPANLSTGTSPNTTGAYTVSWNAVAGASSYKLEERINGGGWALAQHSGDLSKGYSGRANGTYQYRVQACTALGCGAFSGDVTLTVAISSGEVSGFFQVPGSSSTTVGMTAGGLSVDGNGGASYQIPIIVPPGTAGMQPSLAFVYHSGAGNGLMGNGWGLGGLSAITRCRRDEVRDGALGGIEYSSADRFCLDGQRLVAVSGAYGAHGTEYRLEIDNFTKIISYDAAGTGPGRFRAWTKSGQVIDYGNSTDSRIEAQGRGEARVWAMNRMTDVSGNYLDAVYTEDGDQEDYRPLRIEYTLNPGAGLTSPFAKVEFEYDTRSDIAQMYQGGSKLTPSRQRLRNVKTTSRGTLVRDYRVAYDQSGINGVSRVATITECDGVGACLPATSFGWVGNGSAPNLTANPFNLGTGYTVYNPIFGDYNGDGRTDVFLQTKSNGTSWLRLATTDGEQGGTDFLQTGWSVQEDDINTQQIDHIRQILPGDFNADGRTDLALLKRDFAYWQPIIECGYVWNGSEMEWVCVQTGSYPVYTQTIEVHHATSQGTGFTQAGTFALGTDDSTTLKVADMNSDGRADLVGVRSDMFGSYVAAEVRLSGASGVPSATPSQTWATYCAGNFSLGDFNGDGYTDVLDECGELWWSTGGGFNDGGMPLGYLSDAPYVADFNGDGLSDVLLDASVYLAKGNGGFSAAIAAPSGRVSTFIADWNNDGKADLAYHAAGGLMHFQTSTGKESGLFVENLPTQNWSTYSLLPSDFNGDGLTDLWLRSISDDYLFRSTHSGFDLLSQVTNGLGAATSITYARLNDGSGAYTKGTTAVYPIVEIDGPLPVVRLVSTSDGLGDDNRVLMYGYYRARRELTGRRGFGFEGQVNYEPATDIWGYTQFFFAFPYQGRVYYRSRYYLGGANPDVKLNETWNYGGILSTGPGTHHPYDAQVVAMSYELGTHLATQTTISTLDSYGNPTQITSTIVGIASPGTYTTTATSSFLNDTANWRLGRPVCTKVTQAAPNEANQTKTVGYQYDGLGRVQREVIEPRGIDIAEPSGVADCVTSSSEARITLVTETNARDGFGNITQQTSSTVDAPSQSRTTQTLWGELDGANQVSAWSGRFPIRVTNALNHQEHRQYDARFGAVQRLYGPNGLNTTWALDGFGRVTQETRADGTTTTTHRVWCNATLCPGGGTLKTVTVTSGAPLSAVVLDVLGRPIKSVQQGFSGQALISATEYTAKGEVHRASRPYVLGDPITWASFGYDALSRVTSETTPDGTTTSTYTPLQVVVSDPLGHTSTTLRNVRGETIKTWDAAGTVTDYRYDAAGNLKQVQVAGNSATQITNSYNLRGFKTAMVDPDTGAWSYQYNAFGELISQTDAKGQTTTLAYDALGRVSSKSAPEGTSTWSYDAAWKGVGQLASLVSAEGLTQSFSYDSLGRPAGSTTTIDGTSYSQSQSYDSYSRPLVRTYPVSPDYPSGYKVRSGYNSHGHLAEVRNDLTNQLFYRLDSSTVQTRVASYGNGVSETVGYDALGRANALCGSLPLGTCDLQSLQYQFDAASNLTERKDIRQSNLSETFVYDALNRLKETKLNGVVTKTMNYDVLGNLLEKTGIGTYQYDGNPGGCAHAGGVHAVRSAGGQTSCYDANGNTLTSFNHTRNRGRSMSYTSANLVKTITEASQTETFWYDADGNRFKQTNTFNGETTHYLGRYERRSQGGVTTHLHHIDFAGQVIGIYESKSNGAQSLKFLHRDHLGSVTEITSDAGVLIERLSFDAWGKRREANWQDATTPLASSQTPRGYTGHEHLDDTNLIHMNGRVYDPDKARFTSADPIIQAAGYSQSFNRYSYVFNSPLNFTDPSGYLVDVIGPLHFPEPKWWVEYDRAKLEADLRMDRTLEFFEAWDQWRAWADAYNNARANQEQAEANLAATNQAAIARANQPAGALSTATGLTSAARTAGLGPTLEGSNVLGNVLPDSGIAVAAITPDTIFDVGSILYDVGSLAVHTATGNTAAAATDAASLSADAACAVIPIATGCGVAVRATNKGVDAVRTAARGTASVLDDAASAVTKVVRDPAQKRAFLRELAEHPNTPSWQRQWLREGRNPPGYDVDHIKPLSIGGADAPSNMHLILRSDHRLHHKFYRPWEN